MLRSDFGFDLPEELIAQEPLERGTSRMLVVTPSDEEPRLEHRRVAEFPRFLEGGELLVVNDTRVIPARLFAAPKGAMTRPIELLLTRQLAPLRWECWARPARRLHAGDRLTLSDALAAVVLRKGDEGVEVRFELDGGEAAFWPEIERIGVMPLPPYIRREEAREADKRDYQTVFARKAGAIAAPTAGLHFTPEILAEAERRGVTVVRVTLHVGIGTFAPMKVERIDAHVMHTEQYEISEESAVEINRALDERRRVVAVGTTSVRTLESAVRAGQGRISPGSAETSIFIAPGYEFGIVDALLTNFHLPESTLMMLVSAFAGMKTIRAAYAEAIRERYRFFSYGDCMFLRGRGSW
jgi:S-adenosylmethionine:tRNA ribosyltransferase-isomerase